MGVDRTQAAAARARTTDPKFRREIEAAVRAVATQPGLDLLFAPTLADQQTILGVGGGGGGGGGAPTTAQYLVGAADGTLSAERVVTATTTVAWDLGTAGQAKANVPDGSLGTVKLGGDITAAGKALLDDADASAQRTTLGLGTAATQASSAFEAAGAVSTHSASTSGVHGISAFGATLVDDADAAAARTTLGLATVASSGSASDLSTGTLPDARLASVGPTGSYTSANITVDAQGRVTAASNGSGGGGSTPTGTGLVHVTAGVQDAATFAAPAASLLLGRGSAAGAGDPEWIELGTNLSFSGTVLNATVSTDPIKSVYNPGAFTLATDRYSIMAERLEITSTNEVVLEGTATLRIT